MDSICRVTKDHIQPNGSGISKMTPSEDVKKGIQRGIDYLKENKPPVVKFDLMWGDWRSICARNIGAEKLGEAIEDGVDLGRRGFAHALQDVIKKAQREIGYRFELKPIAPKNGNIKLLRGFLHLNQDS